MNWSGTKYCGLTLDWDYKNREVHISMPGYVKKALTKFKHSRLAKNKNQPHAHLTRSYG